MRGIPPPVASVTVPQYFSPSHFAAAGDCLLRSVLRKSSPVAPLRAHPAAQLGRVFHDLIERVLKGAVDPSEKIEDDLRRELERLLGAAERRLSASPETAPFADLRSTLSPLEWRQKRRALLDVAREMSRMQSSGSRGADNRGNPRFSYVDLPAEGKWAEVPFTVEALRLRGRIDIVEKFGNTTVVKDLKTGRVFDQEGDIRRNIRVQLQLYGVGIRRLEPDREVQLVVDDGCEHLVEFGEEVAKETEDWLLRMLSRLPASAELGAEELGEFGRSCRWCSFRHACPIYRRAAPQRWADESDVPLPLDTWGKLRRLDDRGSVVDLEIRDAAGRRVKVFGVDHRRLAELRVGNHVALFGLRAQGSNASAGGWRHPQNFHEVPIDGLGRRAWSLQVFLGPVR